MKYIKNLLQLYNDTIKRPFLVKPVTIQFPVNDICNSRCVMCDIWKNKKTYQITPKELSYILKDPLYTNVQSIGLNGGEPTLRSDLIDIAKVSIKYLPSLKSISLITNAIKIDRCIQVVDQLGDLCSKTGKMLDIMVSLDGVSKTHDNVRGRKGNFKKAETLIDHILDHQNVSVSRIGCTFVKENIYDAEKILQWCIEKGIYARFRLGIRHNRLYNRDDRSSFYLNNDEKYHLANFLDYLIVNYEKDFQRQNFYISLRNQIIYGSSRTAGCKWKNKGVTITSKGELTYCAVESPILGSALDDSSSEIYWGSNKVRKNIISNKCNECAHDYSGLTGKKERNKIIFTSLLKKIKISNETLDKSLYNYAKYKHKKIVRNIDNLNLSKPKIIKRPKRILMIGWYGTETLGDKAILAGIALQLKKQIPDIHFDIASFNEYLTIKTVSQMDSLFKSRVINYKESKNNISKGFYSMVLIAGGPLMSKVTKCFTLLDIFINAKNSGIPCGIIGSGLGPFTGDYRDDAVQSILKISDFILLRDSHSYQLVKSYFKLACPAEVILDPAFIWINNVLENIDQYTNKKIEVRKNKKWLLCLRDWPYNEYGGGLDKEELTHTKLEFENQLKFFADHVKNNNENIDLIPFSMHKHAVGGDDRFFHMRQWKNHKHIRNKIEYKHKQPITDLMTYYNSDFILAMRFHSVVFSLALGIPFFAIDYTRGGKIHGLLEQLNIKNQSISIEKFKYDKPISYYENISQSFKGYPQIKDIIVDSKTKMKRIFESFL
jgi:polysaccharide pyruvyl transferase WcaK-like protein/MoaA/NifB/PqqE/SkfB family radical SAM enzyme